jgi:predicted dehydrogenase
VQDNRESPVSGEMGRRDIATLEAIYAAAASGKRVEVKL